MLINEFIEGLQDVHVSNRKTAERLQRKHCRSGKIARDCPIKEARGIEVRAYGYDELGNVVALLPNGGIRQYI